MHISYLSIIGANLKTFLRYCAPLLVGLGVEGEGAQNISFRLKLLGFPLHSFSSQFVLKIKGSIIIWRGGHLKFVITIMVWRQ